jgi:iron complex outermembrane receptor protein
VAPAEASRSRSATYAEFISRNGAMVPGYVTTTRVNEPGRTLWVKLDLRY